MAPSPQFSPVPFRFAPLPGVHSLASLTSVESGLGRVDHHLFGSMAGNIGPTTWKLSGTKTTAACLFALSLFLQGCQERAINNRVNEHTFAKVIKEGSESAAAEILGNASASGEGDVARCEGREGLPIYFICMNSDKTAPDYYQSFESPRGEEIRLLFQNGSGMLVAAEYRLDGIQIYHFGKKSECRAVSFAECSNINSGYQPESLSRKKELQDFFKASIDDLVNKPIETHSNPPSDGAPPSIGVEVPRTATARRHEVGEVKPMAPAGSPVQENTATSTGEGKSAVPADIFEKSLQEEAAKQKAYQESAWVDLDFLTKEKVAFRSWGEPASAGTMQLNRLKFPNPEMAAAFREGKKESGLPEIVELIDQQEKTSLLPQSSLSEKDLKYLQKVIDFELNLKPQDASQPPSPGAISNVSLRETKAPRKTARERAEAAAERNAAEKQRQTATEVLKWRTWTQSGEQFEAKFAGMALGDVKLVKRDGTTITVLLDDLSDEDRVWIKHRSH